MIIGIFLIFKFEEGKEKGDSFLKIFLYMINLDIVVDSCCIIY